MHPIPMLIRESSRVNFNIALLCYFDLQSLCKLQSLNSPFTKIQWPVLADGIG